MFDLLCEDEPADLGRNNTLDKSSLSFIINNKLQRVNSDRTPYQGAPLFLRAKD
jgi:hypothetical protein